MPVIIDKKPAHDIRIAVWKITETEEALTACLPPLYPAEQALLGKFSFMPRRLEWLASRALVYKITGIYPSISYNDCGQPVMKNAPLKISISHTRGYAAVAVSPTQTTGIDIEYPSPRIEKVAHRFLHPSETAFVNTPHKTNQLAIIWCAKEALFKMAGKKELIFKDDLIVEAFIPKNQGDLTVHLARQGTMHPIAMQYVITSSFYMVYSISPLSAV